jgi:diaminopimelate decarboxylase
MINEEIFNSGTIGGVHIDTLVENYGSPLYAYDAEIIRQRYTLLRQAFSGYPSKLHYAAKACTNLHIMQLLHDEGCGLDTVSINEAKTGLLAGYEASEILYTPSSVSMIEIEQAVNLGIHPVLDNLNLLEAFGEKYGNSYPCSIRLNPDILAGGHARIQVGHKESKFGIPAYQLNEIVTIVKRHDLNIRGLHCHVGSEIAGKDPFLRVLDLLLNALENFPSASFVDIGSGFKIPYYRNHPEEDILSLGKAVTDRMVAFSKETGKTPDLFLEPGKYLVADAGYFIATVRSLKPIQNQLIAGLNSGFNHLLRPMFYEAFHEIVNVSNPNGSLHEYTLVGNICETDFFARNRELNEIREGDHIVFLHAGAYGFSMSSNYNSHERPAEVLVEGGSHRLIRRRETFDDLMATQLSTFDHPVRV